MKGLPREGEGSPAGRAAWSSPEQGLRKQKQLGVFPRAAWMEVVGSP